MLTLKPGQRYHMDDIINHKWFRGDTDTTNNNEDLKDLIDQIENM